ncbi:MAG: YciI family protein [Myxococcales bacterium]|nr:YciI family protein [Myxococcales bacterium]
MQYLLLFNSSPEDLDRLPDDPESAPYWESWRAYMTAIYAAGVVKSGNALRPGHTATTVRIRDGKRLVQDGPFADTKEILGGYLVIDVPSLDEALVWAARSPSSESGSTEVRPILDLKR